LKWIKDGSPASEFDCRAEAGMSATVTNLEEGSYVNFLVYEEGYSNKQRYIKKVSAQIEQGTATASYVMLVSRERLASLGEGDELKYVFAVETTDGWVRSSDSPAAQVVFSYEIGIKADMKNVDSDDKYRLESDDGTYKKALSTKEDILETDGRLILRFEKVVPGKKYSLTCIRKGESEGWKMFRNLGFPELITKINGRS
jgi:hypothetical protein